MTRFIDDRDGSGPGIPSFLQEPPEDRPEPTDLSLHFHDAGPSYRTAGQPPTSHAQPPAQPAARLGEDTQAWSPSLAYRAVAPSSPKPDDYALQPGSYLAAVEALTASSGGPADDPAQGEPREWDPLTDPWPLGKPGGANLEDTLLERAARERVAPYGLMAYEPGAFSLPPVPRFTESPSAGYSPVVFAPAPYVGEGGGDDPALMTQPFDLALEHPSGPLPRHGQWPPASPVPDTPAGLSAPPEFAPPRPAPDSAYDVTLTGPLGTADLGFTGGRWYSIAGDEARPVGVGDAVWSHPELAGQIVQVACWWMRENPKADRALDLATEIAMAVSDAVRGNRTPLVF